jgi:HSP20 family protein
MGLIKYKNYDPLKELDVFQGFFDSFNNYALNNKGGVLKFIPKNNIKETEKSYIIYLEAAGFKKEDIKISVKENILSIEGERKDVDLNEGEFFIAKEIKNSSFNTSFNLPSEIKEEQINAKLEDGILEIIIPKDEVEINKQKEIEIKIK